MKVGNKCSLLPVMLLMSTAELGPGLGEASAASASSSHRRSPKRYLPDVPRSRNHRAATHVTNLMGKDYDEVPWRALNVLPRKDKTIRFVSPRNLTTVTGQTATTVILKCVLSAYIENMTVSWLKKEAVNSTKTRIIARGEQILDNDKRFLATNEGRRYALNIRYSQIEDEGIYECRLSADRPPMSIFIKLDLEESVAEIVGLRRRFVKPGAPLRLSCILHNSLEEPSYIFWYHWDRMINYDLEMGAAVRTGRTESELIFPRAELKHAGNYSCVPSNARQDTVFVSISSTPGETTSAMQQASRSCSRIGIVWSLVHSILIYLLTGHQWSR